MLEIKSITHITQTHLDKICFWIANSSLICWKYKCLDTIWKRNKVRVGGKEIPLWKPPASYYTTGNELSELLLHSMQSEYEIYSYLCSFKPLKTLALFFHNKSRFHLLWALAVSPKDLLMLFWLEKAITRCPPLNISPECPSLKLWAMVWKSLL